MNIGFIGLGSMGLAMAVILCICGRAARRVSTHSSHRVRARAPRRKTWPSPVTWSLLA